MFTYCRRNASLSDNKETRQFPLEYKMASFNTLPGFNKDPFMCRGLNIPRMPTRQVPSHLFEWESALQGRNVSQQQMCKEEGELPHFATYNMPLMAPLNPIPTGPSAVISTSGVKPQEGVLCRHVTMTTPCGKSCACPLACTCKTLMQDRNKVPFRAVAPRMTCHLPLL